MISFFSGEAENGIAGIKLVEEVSPDIVLTDVKNAPFGWTRNDWKDTRI